MMNIRLSVALALLVVAHAALQAPDGYTGERLRMTIGLGVCAAVIRWLGGVRYMGEVPAWARQNRARVWVLVLAILAITLSSLWQVSQNDRPVGAILVQFIETAMFFTALVIVGQWLRDRIRRHRATTRERAGSEADHASPDAVDPDRDWRRMIRTSPVLALLIVAAIGLDWYFNDSSVKLKLAFVLLPCAYIVRVAAGADLAEFMQQTGWREGLAFQWLVSTVFACVFCIFWVPAQIGLPMTRGVGSVITVSLCLAAAHAVLQWLSCGIGAGFGPDNSKD